MSQPPFNILASESELARRTLISEQRRASLFAVMLSAMVGILAVQILTVGHGDTAFPAYKGVARIMALAALYEWFISRLFARMIKNGTQPQRYRFYINAFIELALPTLSAWIAARHIPAAQAITGIATYPYFLIILLSTLRLDFRLCIFTGLVACSGYSLLCLTHWRELELAWGNAIAEARFGILIRGVMFLVFGLVAGIVSKSIRKNVMETMATVQERERIMHLFGQHLSPAVVNQLLTQPKPELRDICVMVLDIRNFTTYSEDRPAEEVVAYLNTLWGFMVRIVNEHHGFVNKFLGDGFLAIFGAPVTSGIDCKDALAASRHILAELETMMSDGRLPKTLVGIALHSGHAIVGEIGTEQKKEYTVIGDVVNVAFRMEALNKDFGTQLLISELVRTGANIDEGERMEPIVIRGRREPVQLYKIA